MRDSACLLFPSRRCQEAVPFLRTYEKTAFSILLQGAKDAAGGRRNLTNAGSRTLWRLLVRKLKLVVGSENQCSRLTLPRVHRRAKCRAGLFSAPPFSRSVRVYTFG